LVFIFGGLAALGIAGFLTLSNWRIYRDRQTIQANIDKLHEQLQILEEQHQVLQAGIDAAQSGDFQEEKLRDQGYKKPGEEVIAVLPNKTTNHSANNNSPTNSNNFWAQLWAKLSNFNLSR